MYETYHTGRPITNSHYQENVYTLLTLWIQYTTYMKHISQVGLSPTLTTRRMYTHCWHCGTVYNMYETYHTGSLSPTLTTRRMYTHCWHVEHKTYGTISQVMYTHCLTPGKWLTSVYTQWNISLPTITTRRMYTHCWHCGTVYKCMKHITQVGLSPTLTTRRMYTHCWHCGTVWQHVQGDMYTQLTLWNSIQHVWNISLRWAYHQLSLPGECIHIVDTVDQYTTCMKHITQVGLSPTTITRRMYTHCWHCGTVYNMYETYHTGRPITNSHYQENVYTLLTLWNSIQHVWNISLR